MSARAKSDFIENRVALEEIERRSEKMHEDKEALR